MNLDTWEQFESKLVELRDFRMRSAAASILATSNFLYRGQANETWQLATTLERRAPTHLRWDTNYRLVSAARHAVETFTTQSWALEEFPELDAWAQNYEGLRSHRLPGYDYLGLGDVARCRASLFHQKLLSVDQSDDHVGTVRNRAMAHRRLPLGPADQNLGRLC